MNKESKNIILLGIGIIAFILFLVNTNYVGNWNAIGNNILSLWAYMFYTGVGIIYFIKSREQLLGDIMIGGMVGIGWALLVGNLYNNGIWFDTVITAPNTLTDYQTLIIIAWLIIGFFKGVLFHE